MRQEEPWSLKAEDSAYAKFLEEERVHIELANCKSHIQALTIALVCAMVIPVLFYVAFHP